MYMYICLCHTHVVHVHVVIITKGVASSWGAWSINGHGA